MTVEQVRHSLQDEGGRNDLFRLLEAEPRLPDPVRRLYPDLRQHWEPVGGALQVPWQHIMTMELSLVGGFNKGEGDGMILPG